MGKRINTATWVESKKYWKINVQKDGERRSFYSGTPGRKGQRECNGKADAWLEDNLIGPDVKVEKLFKDWLAEVETTTSTANYNQYNSYWNNRIKKRIGNIKIGAITEQHLQMVINDAARDGLSKKTMINLRACMTAFVKYARRCKATTLIVENINIPKSAKKGEREILQPDDLKMLFSNTTSTYRSKEVFEPLVYAWRFQVLTGLRPGELVGLRWEDIDLKNKTVTIKRSINDLGEETTGKNENARRTFVLMDTAYNTLTEYSSKASTISKYVFPNNDGKNISQLEVYNRWKRYKEYVGIKSGATPYELRHTFVSIFKDLPEGLLKPIVGHSVNMDSYGTYGHEVSGDLQRAAELMQTRWGDIIK